jgi:hypothetical protein
MRATFFALSALPFYASAQHPIPDPVPAASESTSTSQAFIPPVINTSEEVPVELQPTSSDVIVVPESTTETVYVNPETTAQLPDVVQESATQQAIGQVNRTLLNSRPSDDGDFGSRRIFGLHTASTFTMISLTMRVLK